MNDTPTTSFSNYSPFHDLKTDPEQVCCFTGHRPGKLDRPEEELRACLEAAIRQAVKDGYVCFITGMAPGIDLWAGETVLKLKEEFPDIKLAAALPYPEFGRRSHNDLREATERLLMAADMVFCVRSEYSRFSYTDRDRWMVDRSSRIIAAFNGSPGGTRYTLEYAAKRGLERVLV